MRAAMGIMGIIAWINFFFPKIAFYTNIIGSFFVFLFGIVSILTDSFPPPNHKFNIPDKEDLYIELYRKKKLVYYISRIARKMTIFVNWFMSSYPYIGFYKTTRYISSLMIRIRLTNTEKKIEDVHLPKRFTDQTEKEKDSSDK
mgnify:CR=1 FL=1